MKIVIDISEDYYNKCVENRKMLYTISYIDDVIAQGTPFEEPKTAEWKKISPAGIYTCTNCGQDVMTIDIDCYKFCHGCGAKMKGVLKPCDSGTTKQSSSYQQLSF